MTKAEAFKNLIKSDELNDEIELMREELVQLIINSDSQDTELREHSYLRIKVINEIMARFESIAKDDEIKDKAWKIL
jgi:hypothetical protein